MCKYFFCLNVRFSYTNLKKKSRNVECEKGKPKMYVLVITNLKKKKMAAMLSAKRANQKKANACLISQT